MVFFTQDRLIFFPQPRMLGKQQLLTLQNEVGALQVSVVERAGGDVLIYFGGNAEDVSKSLDRFAQAFPTHSIYLLHYRGYGGSDGRPSETALYADALLLHAFLEHKYAELGSKLTVVGRSLGSGVATYLASQRNIARLVLITPFDSVRAVAAGVYPFLPITLLLRHPFDSLKYAPKVRARTLILQAEHDSIVPIANSRKLATAFRNPPDYRVLSGTEHNSISAHPDYFRDWVK